VSFIGKLHLLVFFFFDNETTFASCYTIYIYRYRYLIILHLLLWFENSVVISQWATTFANILFLALKWRNLFPNGLLLLFGPPARSPCYVFFFIDNYFISTFYIFSHKILCDYREILILKFVFVFYLLFIIYYGIQYMLI
jgi:hypothetical protein